VTRPRRCPTPRVSAADAPLTPEEQAAYDRQGEIIAWELRWEEDLRAAGIPVPAAMDGVRWGDGSDSVGTAPAPIQARTGDAT